MTQLGDALRRAGHRVTRDSEGVVAVAVRPDSAVGACARLRVELAERHGVLLGDGEIELHYFPASHRAEVIVKTS